MLLNLTMYTWLKGNRIDNSIKQELEKEIQLNSSAYKIKL